VHSDQTNAFEQKKEVKQTSKASLAHLI